MRKIHNYSVVNCTKTSHGDDEEDTIGEPEIKPNREALKIAKKLLEYSRFNGKEKLSLVLSKTAPGNGYSKPKTIENW